MADAQHTPDKPVGYAMRGNTAYCMQNIKSCAEYMRRLERLGLETSDHESPEHHGWSREDSYEDSRSWAQYYAGQIISGDASRYIETERIEALRRLRGAPCAVIAKATGSEA